MTSVTTLLALISLYVLGGDVIRGFVFAMIWGVIVGTYSSVFVASTILLWLGVKRDWSKPSNTAGNQFATSMPEYFGQTSTGLAVLIFAALIGGIVRGFSGFGTALIFLPIASPYLGPFGAIIALTVMDIFGPIPNLRRAWAVVDKADLMRLLFGCAPDPASRIMALDRTQPDVFRYLVSLISLSMLVVLILGCLSRSGLTQHGHYDRWGSGAAGRRGRHTGASRDPVLHVTPIAGRDRPRNNPAVPVCIRFADPGVSRRYGSSFDGKYRIGAGACDTQHGRQLARGLDVPA